MAADASRDEVFIYYANENSPDVAEAENYAVISRWLNSSENAQARKVAAQLEHDRTEFPRVVDLELAALRQAALVNNQRLLAIVVTNRLARSGHFLVLNHEDTEFRKTTIEIPRHENYILNSNPLSRPEVFRLVLTEAARIFDPAQHNFVLLTKSHGNLQMAMTPRLVVRNEETDRDEIISIATGGTSEGDQPTWVGRLGVSKDEYIAILTEAGRKLGMQFSLVVMESCKGDISNSLVQALPADVSQLYDSGAYSAEYSNLDYGRLLAGRDDAHSLATLIYDSLDGRFQRLHHQAKTFPYYALLLLIPLPLWAGTRLLRQRHSRTLS